MGAITIGANIWITLYNVGKNRKIYGIITRCANQDEDINKILSNDDYTILFVGPGNEINSRPFILGKLTNKNKK